MKKFEDDAPTCGGCAYFVPDPEDELGECHKNPPSLFSDDRGMGYCFPSVPANEWCGAFQRKLSA